MHGGTVVVKIPKADHVGRETRQMFLAGVSALDSDPATTRLGENTLKKDCRRNPGALALLVSSRERLAISYGILLLTTRRNGFRLGSMPSPLSPVIGATLNG
jgi:hypothetical protein